MKLTARQVNRYGLDEPTARRCVAVTLPLCGKKFSKRDQAVTRCPAEAAAAARARSARHAGM